ncbi:TIGR03773 family transporter-associated surface protein [Xylanimonas ulmi]|uniref:Putative ABC transporter-associated repeat protein n=1 Tax=Xylanimonas ulmi TaxID=228973 RepID=A0A4Q7M0U6_9MICO|nr:TIGR03773 family transporter-associated surface protein [Xylanibacterium ulmi]RZS60523.1 putative ABC transporter-associated repeat protein [Xylanibacterium ulmi]
MTVITDRRRRALATIGATCLLASGGLALAGPLQAAAPAPPALVEAADLGALTVTYRVGGLALGARDAAGAALDPSAAIVRVFDPAVLDLGVDTDLLPYDVLADDLVTLALTDVTGPGDVTVSTPDDGAGRTLLASGGPRSATVPVGTTLPARWDFSAPGAYAVTLTASATLADGTALSAAPVAYRFQVDAPAADAPPAPEPSLTPGAAQAEPAPPSDSATGPFPTSSPAPPQAEPAPPSDSATGPFPTSSPAPTSAHATPDTGATTPETPDAPSLGEATSAGGVTDEAGPPAGALPAPDTTLLTDTARGDVTLAIDTAAPGAFVTVAVPESLRGRWVSTWVLSTPTDLGWRQVDADATVTLALPQDVDLGQHRVVVREADAALVGWSPLTVASADEAPDQCLPQQVESTLGPGEADVVTSGHFDFGPVVDGAGLRALVKDDRTQPAPWVDPATLVLHLTDDAAVQAPGGEFAFLGAGQVWQVPLTQLPGVPWLGWNTQHPTIAGKVDGEVTLTLDNLEGPGRLAVYSMGSFGNLGERYFGTVEGFERSTAIPVGTSGVHVHAIWAFTEPGAYHATLTFAATVGGERRTGTSTLNFFVGPGDASAAARATTTQQTVGRTADGRECQLPAAAGPTGGGPGGASGAGTLPRTGVDSETLADLTGLTVTLFVVGLAFVAAASLAPRRPATA